MNEGTSRLFRRNLTIPPFVCGVHAFPVATPIGRAQLSSLGITSFKVINPNPFWVWLRGWNGAESDMPEIKEKGHYVAPGMVEVNGSQIPDWVGFQADNEPGFPIFDAQGNWLYEGQRTRCIIIYGSGA